MVTKNLLIHFIAVGAFIFQGIQFVNAQSKGEMEAELTKKTAHNDSLSKQLSNFQTMYKYAADSLVRKDFEPDSFGIIMDSIIKDESIGHKTEMSTEKSLQDSISVLNQKVDMMDKMITNALLIINIHSEQEVKREELEIDLDDKHANISKQLSQ